MQSFFKKAFYFLLFYSSYFRSTIKNIFQNQKTKTRNQGEQTFERPCIHSHFVECEFKTHNSECLLHSHHDTPHASHITHYLIKIPTTLQFSLLSPFQEQRNWNSVMLRLNLSTSRSQDLYPGLCAFKVHVFFITLYLIPL